MEIKFTKKKFAFTSKVNEVLGSKLVLSMGHENDDILTNTFTTRIEGFILSRFLDQQKVISFVKPQNFWYCLLRRPQRIELVIKFEEVLKNPPALSNNESIVIKEIINP